MLGDDTLPVDHTDEIGGAVKALNRRIVAMGGALDHMCLPRTDCQQYSGRPLFRSRFRMGSSDARCRGTVSN